MVSTDQCAPPPPQLNPTLTHSVGFVQASTRNGHGMVFSFLLQVSLFLQFERINPALRHALWRTCGAPAARRCSPHFTMLQTHMAMEGPPEEESGECMSNIRCMYRKGRSTAVRTLPPPPPARVILQMVPVESLRRQGNFCYSTSLCKNVPRKRLAVL